MMKPSLRILAIVGVILLCSACTTNKKEIIVRVINSSSIDRHSETVEVLKVDLNSAAESDFLTLGVIDVQSNETVLSQHIDKSGDGTMDALIFQANVIANSEKLYEIVQLASTKTVSKVFSRFVPERTDDYAWENDRVAFRTYGPAAQRMIEEGVPGGTLSSGMDCWLKKVDYPVIDKWYKKNASGEGSYHEDTGEGLDNFHVGSSRGCGGLGVYRRDTLYTSKNFTAYQTLANGPLRTEFTLEYQDWNAGGTVISEQKKISLDLGSNLMHITAFVGGTRTITVGLTLHENDGAIAVDTVNGSFSYWQPHGDSELGTAIVVHPEYYAGFTKVVSDQNEKSQLLVHLNIIDNRVEYEAGFTWKESNQFPNRVKWEEYLVEKALAIQDPLEIVLE